MQQNVDPVISTLYQKKRSEIKTGLHRVQEAFEVLGKPAINIPCVLVGGTNGKGTTSSFIFNIMEHLGKRVGIYTSPHIIQFAERVQMSDKEITSQELVEYHRQLETKLPRSLYEELSFFEITTLMALMCFASREPDVLVIEVGMGGRWDATNILDPIASVIVSVGFDHQDYLGDTLAKIAAEKVEIMRPGRPCFWGGSDDMLVESVVDRHAKKIGAKLVRVSSQGQYLEKNCHLALKVAEHILCDDFAEKIKTFVPFYSDDDKPRWPPTAWGRFHHINLQNEPINLLFDACHNVDGVKTFLNAIHDKYGRDVKLPGLVTILADKNIDEMLALLKQNISPLLLFQIDNQRTLQSNQVVDKIYACFSEAWQEAKRTFLPSAKLPWVICGSIYGIGEVFQFLNIKIQKQ